MLPAAKSIRAPASHKKSIPNNPSMGNPWGSEHDRQVLRKFAHVFDGDVLALGLGQQTIDLVFIAGVRDHAARRHPEVCIQFRVLDEDPFALVLLELLCERHSDHWLDYSMNGVRMQNHSGGPARTRPPDTRAKRASPLHESLLNNPTAGRQCRYQVLAGFRRRRRSAGQ